MVIRVQDENGDGPYYQCFGIDDMDKMAFRHAASRRHPNPGADMGIERYMRINERCGFANWQQFVNWFSAKELKMMAKHGYYPVRIDAEPTVVGEYQCLFEG